MVSKLSWLLIAAGVPAVLAAQTPASVQRAVNSVTPQDVVRRIAIIADDSMLGRATPSPQLEQVAQYIAAEFQRFGLRPGGERGTYFQRYSVERAVLATDSSAVWSTGSLALRWAYEQLRPVLPLLVVVVVAVGLWRVSSLIRRRW